MSKAIEDIAVERARQIELGWTPEHDDEHSFGHLMNLALGRIRNELAPPSRDELVQAAALIVAGIEWMDRAAPEREIRHEAVHWVSDAPTSLHGNGASSFAHTTRVRDEVTCRLCLSLLDATDREVGSHDAGPH